MPRRRTLLFTALVLALSTSAAGKDATTKRPKPARTAKAVKGKAQPKRAGSAKERRERRARTSRLLEILPGDEHKKTPAYRYANFTNEQAYAELERRSIRFRKESPGPTGVRAPIRLLGPLHGVNVHSSVPPAERATSRFEVLDARLALALDDFCQLLEREGIVELVHYTMYRPGASPPADSDALPTRHPGGLAIDVGALRRRDGSWLDVGLHWQGQIGDRTCGPGAKSPTADNAQALVALVCETAAQRIFHYMLTPHYDEHHRDHLHLEIKPAVKWFLVQ